MRLVNKVKFPKQRLLDEELPYSALKNDIVGQRRWMTEHEIIFELDGKFWQTFYDEGSTEMQDGEPWEYEDEVQCIQVHETQMVVTKWVPIE